MKKKKTFSVIYDIDIGWEKLEFEKKQLYQKLISTFVRGATIDWAKKEGEAWKYFAKLCIMSHNNVFTGFRVHGLNGYRFFNRRYRIWISSNALWYWKGDKTKVNLAGIINKLSVSLYWEPPPTRMHLVFLKRGIVHSICWIYFFLDHNNVLIVSNDLGDL